jgi:hypothetical protein
LGGGRIEVVGSAPANARVRLASPNGRAVFTEADATGVWRMIEPAPPDVRLFGLSAPIAGHTVQAEGYLALVPGGDMAQLRAGTGALGLNQRSSSPELLAADFDGKGVVVVSGRADPGAPVAIAVDGAVRGQARAGGDGRFQVAFNEPLPPGTHLIALGAGRARVQGPLDISAAAPLNPGPFRAQRLAGAWRIDWLTPGGGVQSTILYDRRPA